MIMMNMIMFKLQCWQKTNQNKTKSCHLQKNGWNWMEIIMLSEISQTQKSKCMFSLICGSRIQIKRLENRKEAILGEASLQDKEG
jgi:hypothetical protein